MIVTEKITLSNQKRYISIDSMFSFLFNEYNKILDNLKRNKRDQIDRYGELNSLIRTMCIAPYEIFRTIIMSQLILDFIEWKPYVKSVDVEKLKKFLDKKLRLSTHQDMHSNRLGEFYTKDIEISILYFLSQKEMHFDRLKHMPRVLIKMTSLHLYGEYILNKLFEKDYREGKMLIFSNKKEIERRRNYRDYGYKYKYRNSRQAEYNSINFNYQDYRNYESTYYNTSGTTYDVASTVSTANTFTTSGEVFTFMNNDDSSGGNVWTTTYPLAV